MKGCVRVASIGLLLFARTAGAATLSPVVVFQGMCDASAAVALDYHLVAVANDEDNILRVYDSRTGGPPLEVCDVSTFLGTDKKKGVAEADLEAATRVGMSGPIYWVTSHGRKATGKASAARHRFFATEVVRVDGRSTLRPIGQPYARLLRDLTQEPRLAPFGLKGAALLAPKERGALNIEGLCATPRGEILIGFRNPIPQGKALVVPLLNPGELIRGYPARFGNPLLLDLGGLGVRSLGYDGTRYLIIAGPYDASAGARLYQWAGDGTAPQWLNDVRFGGLNPEGVAVYHEDGHAEFFILSDDGTLSIRGQDCKRLADPMEKRFRGYRFVR